MADKADQALKLAQKVEEHLKKVEKNLLDAINERAKNMTDLHNDQNKRLNEMEKKFTEAHNQQAKELDGVVAWAKKTFDTKGWF
jgi:Asp-tRNA(Asn)/Glu-tRNA(Gln) amidotransferase A subunit family amidase